MKNKKHRAFRFVQKTLFAIISVICIIQIGIIQNASGQCQPYIQIDGASSSPSGLPLPIWLHSDQILGMNSSVSSVSIVEFTVNGASLEFSQVLSVTSSSTVPSNKVWKIESIATVPLTGTVLSSKTFSTAGTTSFTVPNCTNYICIEVWGAGGGGGGGNGGTQNGGGGGGGGYGSGCFTVTPGSSISVIVGAGGTRGNPGTPGTDGGTGGTTSVGALISATGGTGGLTTGGYGTFGSSTANINLPGSNGTSGGTGSCNAGTGGAGANGGAGGAPGCNNGGTGGAPGGGGGGGNVNGGTPYYGGYGAAGQVKISW